MVISIIRAILAIDGVKGVDTSWLYAWGLIENAVGEFPLDQFKERQQPANPLCLAITIACLVSSRSLLRKASVSQNRYRGSSSLHSTAAKTSTQNETVIEGGKNPKTSSSSTYLGEEVVPLNAINVRHEYAVFPDLELDPVQTVRRESSV